MRELTKSSGRAAWPALLVPNHQAFYELLHGFLTLARREQWLQAAKRAFDEIERQGGMGVSTAGTVRSSHLIDLLRARLPSAEVDYAVEDALLEAGAAGARVWGVRFRVQGSIPNTPLH